MFKKGKDLERIYPEVATLVASLVKISGGQIYGFYFTKKPRIGTGNAFRFKGILSDKQVRALLRIHPKLKGSPADLVKKNGWMEFARPVSLKELTLKKTLTFEFLPNLRNAVEEFSDDLTDDPDLLDGMVFVNGRMISEFWFFDDDWMTFGDVFVVFSDDGWDMNAGSLRPFEDMPLLKVFNRKSEMGWKSKPSYQIESSALVGTGSATELLLPFAPIVIGRTVSGNLYDWPKEVVKLIIDGSDYTHKTCQATIDVDSTIEVYLD